MSRDTELALFRVLQESLTNVHRHSGSPSALIRLEREDGSVRLEVCDEGRGLPSGKRRGLGVGIAGMRERMRQLGGRLEVESSSCGTTIRAILPLTETAPSSV